MPNREKTNYLRRVYLKPGHTHVDKETATAGPVKKTFNKRAPSEYIDAQISLSLKFQESHATSAWLVCTEN